MSDEIGKILAEKGYNSVAIPTSDIAPFDLLVLDGNSLSSLNTKFDILFEPDILPLPRVIVDSFANIEGKKQLDFNSTSGINMLGAFTSLFGGGENDLSANAVANRKSTLSFSFQNIKKEIIDYVDLDHYLSGAFPIEEQFRTYTEKLKRSELYIITSVLKSNAMKITIDEGNAQNVDLKAEVSSLAKANVVVERSSNNGLSLSSSDGDDLVFAFKAVQILYDRPKWFEFWKPDDAKFRIKNVKGVSLLGEEDFPVKYLSVDKVMKDES